MDFNSWYDKIYKYPYLFTSNKFNVDNFTGYAVDEYNVNNNDYGFYIPPNMNFQTIPLDAFLYKDANNHSNLINKENSYAPVYNINFSNDIDKYILEGCNINILSDYNKKTGGGFLAPIQNIDGFSKNIDGYRIAVEKHKTNNVFETNPDKTRIGNTDSFAIHRDICYKHTGYIDLYTGMGWENGNLNISNNKMEINKGESVAVTFTPLSDALFMKHDFKDKLKIKNIQITLCLKAL